MCFSRCAFLANVLRAGVLDLHGRLVLIRRQVNLGLCDLFVHRCALVCASDGLRSLRRCSVLVCLIFTVALVAFACLILVVLVLDLHGRLDRARILDPRGLRCDHGHLLGWALVCASGGVRSLRRCSALVCLIFMVASCSYLGK